MLLAVGCDDKENQAAEPPMDPKSLWSEGAIQSYIGCEPVDSALCKCVIEKITAVYTPEQVRQRPPMVASDLLAAHGKCLYPSTDEPVPQTAPAQPTTMPKFPPT